MPATKTKIELVLPIVTRVLCRTSCSFSRSTCRAPGWGSATNVENQVVANEVHHQRTRRADARETKSPRRPHRRLFKLSSPPVSVERSFAFHVAWHATHMDRSWPQGKKGCASRSQESTSWRMHQPAGYSNLSGGHWCSVQKLQPRKGWTLDGTAFSTMWHP